MLAYDQTAYTIAISTRQPINRCRPALREKPGKAAGGGGRSLTTFTQRQSEVALLLTDRHFLSLKKPLFSLPLGLVIGH